MHKRGNMGQPIKIKCNRCGLEKILFKDIYKYDDEYICLLCKEKYNMVYPPPLKPMTKSDQNIFAIVFLLMVAWGLYKSIFKTKATVFFMLLYEGLPSSIISFIRYMFSTILIILLGITIYKTVSFICLSKKIKKMLIIPAILGIFIFAVNNFVNIFTSNDTIIKYYNLTQTQSINPSSFVIMCIFGLVFYLSLFVVTLKYYKIIIGGD